MQTTRPFRLQTALTQAAAASAQSNAAAAGKRRSSTAPKTPGATFGHRVSAAGATLLTVVFLLGGVLSLAEFYSDGSPAGAVLALDPAGADRTAG